MEEVVINSDTLEWSRAEDVRIKCVAISINKDNTKTQVEFGEPNGNQITIHKEDMDAKSLEFAAKEWIKENINLNLEKFVLNAKNYNKKMID